MSADRPFTKDHMDRCLKELAREFRKKSKFPVEIILVGGASILINYGFREMTYDMDAIIHSSYEMKDTINTVGDKLGLPTGWLNTDFTKTSSYTPRLVQYSKYYKTFSDFMQIRTVTSEYLVAVKLMAGRQYKNDLSDIVGILIEQEEQGDPLSLDRIKKAVVDLYDSYDRIPQNSRTLIESIYEKEDIGTFYQYYRELERENKNILPVFQDDDPNVLKEDNLADVLKAARAKQLK